MNTETLHGPLKAFAIVVLALMLLALLYSGYISITHWSGIGV
jgi:hypothetical protein